MKLKIGQRVEVGTRMQGGWVINWMPGTVSKISTFARLIRLDATGQEVSANDYAVRALPLAKLGPKDSEYETTIDP